MTVPLRPLAAIALQTGVLAAAIWAMRRGLSDGRTDQRAEDAFEDLDEGLALHRPVDRAVDGVRQTNAAARIRRTLRWNGGGVEVDAGFIARLKIRRF